MGLAVKYLRAVDQIEFSITRILRGKSGARLALLQYFIVQEQGQAGQMGILSKT